MSGQREISLEDITLQDNSSSNRANQPGLLDNDELTMEEAKSAGYTGEADQNGIVLKSMNRIKGGNDPEDPNRRGDTLKSNLLSACFNFTNSIIGAGIIGLPLAMREAGLPFGLILMIIIGVIVAYTVDLLPRLGKMAGKNNYPDLCYHAFGKWGFYYMGIMQFLFPFGAMIAYLVIIGDSMVYACESSTNNAALTSRYFWISMFSWLIIFPICLPKNVAHLAKFSGLSLLSVVFVVLTVTIEGAKIRNEDSFETPDGAYSFADSRVFQAIGIISFAYVCHHNTFLLFDSLQDRTLNRFRRVVYISVGFSVAMSVWMATAGYVTFFDKTDANILNNFPTDNTAINFARVLFSLTMILTFPLELFVCRNVGELLLFKDYPFSTVRHVSWTFGLVAVPYTIAMLTDDLSAVLELTGDFAASSLAYILPGALYLKIAEGPILSKKKAPALAVMIFGIIVLIIGTTVDIYNIVTDDNRDGDFGYN
eukprot:Nk52_evm1s1489 gene=Nk52_evmTU1s1489